MIDIYSTQDFYVASYLLSKGEKMISQARHGNITTFYFENTGTLKELECDFYAMRASVNPVSYANSIKRLKSIIHNNTQLNGMYNNNGNFTNM